MTDIVETLRERPIRYASETQDEMQIRRQRERERGADEIERLRAEVELYKARAETPFIDGYEIAKDEYRPRLIEAEEENDQLRAALRTIDEELSKAAQNDCENGVRWLNERAAGKYLYEYPHTSGAISFACKVARAALEERT